ncbi:hypothetical protein DL93DRAFT_2155044 [Clavulina sp. PMI_390]|nr:hypothetical protein DL93DRAFT_2155044 [Clavulina sp. PMI_390]
MAFSQESFPMDGTGFVVTNNSSSHLVPKNSSQSSLAHETLTPSYAHPQVSQASYPPPPPTPQVRSLPPPTPATYGTWFWVCLPPIGHFSLSLLTALGMKYYIQGRLFAIHSRHVKFGEVNGLQGILHQYVLLQTDVTTILSVFLAIIRSLGGIWFAGLCWRAAFLILEKDGLRLKDFNRLISRDLLHIFFIPLQRRGRSGIVVFYAIFAILLALPAQYAGPVLSGAITWVPASIMASGHVPLSGISTLENGPGQYGWTRYAEFAANRAMCQTKSAAYAGLAWSASDAINTTSLLTKRIITNAKPLAANSTVKNITLPLFAVHSITWLTADQLNETHSPSPDDAINSNAGLTNVSQSDSPLQTVAPTLAIVPATPYTLYQQDTIPTPSKIVAQTGLLALFAMRQNGTGACGTISDSFGALPMSDIGFRASEWFIGSESTTNCYIFANVTYSAGVATCNDCVLGTEGGIFERNITELAPSLLTHSPSDGDAFLSELQADPMTLQAFHMMPEVIATMATMNVSLPPTWNNIDQYAREMLARSYAASWTVVTDVVASSYVTSFSEIAISPSDEAGTGVSTPVSIAVSALRASISMTRLMVWLGLQLLLLISAIFFIMIQATAARPLSRSPELDLLMLDTSELRRKAGWESDPSWGDHPAGGGKAGVALTPDGLQPTRVKPEVLEENNTLIVLKRADGYTVIHYDR